MPERSQDDLGEPQLTLGPLRLWVRGREYPKSLDSWDGNWLVSVAHACAAGADITISGAFLEAVSLVGFLRQLERLHETLSGSAELKPLEPDLRITLYASDRVGHISGRVEMTPDQMSQGHWFNFSLDQTSLPGLIAQVRSLVEAFPPVTPNRGA